MSRSVCLALLLTAAAFGSTSHAQSAAPAAVPEALAYRLPNADPPEQVGLRAHPQPSARIPLSRQERTTRGAIVGGVAGGVLGLTVVTFSEAVEGNSDFTSRNAAGLIGGAVFGAVVGGLLGRATTTPGAP